MKTKTSFKPLQPTLGKILKYINIVFSKEETNTKIHIIYLKLKYIS